MTFWVQARQLLQHVRHDLQGRGRLLAAALAPTRARAPSVRPANEPIDLISGLNQAGQDAGLNAWDWDIDAGTFRFNHETMGLFGVESAAARAGRARHPT